MTATALTRRSLVAGLAGLPLVAALPRAWAAPAPALEFDILRKGAPIGSHRIAAEPAAGRLSIAIETDIQVRLLGVTAYRYRHEGREDWRRRGQELRLVGLRTRTDDNGKRFAVDGAAEDGVFRILGSAGELTAPPTVVPASYWTPLVLERDQLINPKRGTLLPVAAERRGREIIESAGERVETERSFIAGDPAVHLWFDDRQRVRRLAFESRGEFIDYRLRSLDAFGLDERVF